MLEMADAAGSQEEMRLLLLLPLQERRIDRALQLRVDVPHHPVQWLRWWRQKHRMLRLLHTTVLKEVQMLLLLLLLLLLQDRERRRVER